jgi:FKBP-type peptidyl-prolyl cis-trans isomerase (trigger factor)
MVSALSRREDGTTELTINIPWARVKQAYDQIVDKAVKETAVNGFRRGKAPRHLVESKLDKNKVYEEIIKQVVPVIYTEAVKEHQLKPIVYPQIKVVSLAENKDWQIQAISCEQPVVELGNYPEEIRKETAASKIVVPGKKEEPEKENQQLAKVFQVLLKTSRATIPKILLEGEVNRMLARLVDQTSRLGLTIEQYLSSTGKSTEQLRTEYTQQAEETLKLEFILQEIANREKITVSEAEVAKMIAAAPDEASRQALQTPEQRAYLEQLLRKRQVIEKLLKI